MRKVFIGLRCVFCTALDVVVMKRHDCAIGSHTGLWTVMLSAGTAAGATWVVSGDDGGAGSSRASDLV